MKQISLLEEANKKLTTQVQTLREYNGALTNSEGELRNQVTAARMKASKLEEELGKAQEQIIYHQTLSTDVAKENEETLAKVREVLGSKDFKDLMFMTGIMDATSMKWHGGEEPEERQQPPEEQEAAIKTKKKEATASSVPKKAAGSNERNAVWHEDIRNIPMVETPPEDLLNVARSVMTSKEARTIEYWREEVGKWATQGVYAEEKKFTMLRGKMESVMVYGAPHAPGLLYEHATTIGRLANIIRHYKNLQEVTTTAILGAAGYITEAEIFGLRAALVAEEAEEKAIIIFIRMKGNHAFAEDGGRVQASKGSKGKGGASKKPWNKWERTVDGNE